MIKAVKTVRNKELGSIKASKVFNGPNGMVERYSKSDKSPEELLKVSIGRKPIFSAQLETCISPGTTLLGQAQAFSLRSGDIKQIALQLAVKNRIHSMDLVNQLRKNG